MRRLRAFALLGLATLATACGSTTISGDPPQNNETILKQGSFYHVAHTGKGTASLVKKPDGSLIVRLSNFEVENGPDLYVYVASIAKPDGKNISSSNAFALAKLSNASEYPVPTNTKPDDLRSVVIWCKAFSANFISASLE
jgi:hypothetical protein